LIGSDDGWSENDAYVEIESDGQSDAHESSRTRETQAGRKESFFNEAKAKGS